MPSNKTSSKKTRKASDPTKVAATETNHVASVNASKQRTNKSSTVKSDKTEASAAKRHRKSAFPQDKNKPALKSLAAAAGASMPETPVTIVSPQEPVAAVAHVTETIAVKVEFELPRRVLHEEIAKLAHSYFAARGYQHGDPREDWLRAERELTSGFYRFDPNGEK